MNTILWIAQILLALICLASGLFKTFLPEEKLVAKGQTGVEKLDPMTIKFIGISEILLAFGLTLPWYLHTAEFFTPLSAFLFSVIMILASGVHYKRFKKLGIKKEKQN